MAIAIPLTVLNASEDIYKASFNGDIATSQFWADFIPNQILNLLFNTLAGPGAVPATKVRTIVKEIPRGSSAAYSQGGRTVYHIFTQSETFVREVPYEVVDFVFRQSDEAVDFFFTFLNEFVKIMRTALPPAIFNNSGSGN